MMGWIGRLKGRLSNSWIGRLVIGGWQWTKSLPNSTAFWLASVGIVVLGSILGLDSWGWDWLSETEPNLPPESRSTTIRNAGFVIAGAIALVFAVWRGVVAQRQSETSQQGLLNERYQRGAEMLGSEVLSVRMGGIYALQRLAGEQAREYHCQIMGLLCSFARHPTRDDAIVLRSDGKPEGNDEQGGHIREDVQAVMELLAWRSETVIALEEESASVLDLRGADLRGLHLWGAKLCKANLDGARLQGSNLTDANLSQSSLEGADLSKSEIIMANLSGARMRRVVLIDTMLMDADLSRTSMWDTDLSGARLLSANVSDAMLLNTNLSRAHLMGIDLSGTDLLGVNLTGAFFANPSADDSVDGMLITSDAPVRGLTQHSLDSAQADQNNAPKLEGVLDAETGEQLVWRGRPLDEGP